MLVLLSEEVEEKKWASKHRFPHIKQIWQDMGHIRYLSYSEMNLPLSGGNDGLHQTSRKLITTMASFSK